MKSKYWSYTYLSIKTLILNRSIMLGFIFNLLIALMIVAYVIIFQPDINIVHMTQQFSNASGLLKVIIIVIVMFLFSSVAGMMQSVIDDRDSKVTEIINTSVLETHYLFGKKSRQSC